MFSGYKEDFLPFIDVLSLEDAWREASKVINTEHTEKYQSRFERSYGLLHSTLNLLSNRYQFYLGILNNDPEIMGQYGDEIGDVQLTERVVYAMHGCIDHGERLNERANSLINEFSSIIGNDSPYYGPPSTSCESTGVYLCEGSNPPYMWGCMTTDNSRLLEDDATYQRRMERSAEHLAPSLIRAMELLDECE
jgi:hypothetical protein